MYASTLKYSISKNTNMVSVFGGINNTYGCAEGEWRDESGLTSEYFPTLSSEKANGSVESLFFEAFTDYSSGMHMSSDGMIFLVRGNYILVRFKNEQDEATVCAINMTQNETFPDISYDPEKNPQGLGVEVYKNTSFADIGTKTLVFGSPHELLEQSYNVNQKLVWIDREKLKLYEGELYHEVNDITEREDDLWGHAEKSEDYTCSLSLCTLSGEEYKDVSTTYPDSPSDGDYVYDETKGVLYVYSATLKDYTAVDTVYCKISATGIDETFDRYDTVKIYNMDVDDVIDEKVLDAVCGYKTIHQKGEGYIIVTANIALATAADVPLRVAKEIPKLDYLFSHKNRVYGCRYGEQPQTDARTLDRTYPFVNEIYVSGLGDFASWYAFEGISTDSYTASVGTGAEFTGAVAYGDTPLFFKKDRIYALSGNNPAEFTLSEFKCDGVAVGADKTIATLNGVLYYVSPFGVCAYTGGLPQRISDNFGYNLEYQPRCGFAYNNRYYVCISHEDGVYLYIFDAVNGIWHRHSTVTIKSICGIDKDSLYILYTNGTIETMYTATDALDRQVYKDWYAESADIGFSYPDKKYISLIRIRLSLDEGAEVHLKMSYDGENKFEEVTSITDVVKNTEYMEITPKRCDSFRMRLEGKGGARIFSITYDLENGGVR